MSNTEKTWVPVDFESQLQLMEDLMEAEYIHRDLKAILEEMHEYLAQIFNDPERAEEQLAIALSLAKEAEVGENVRYDSESSAVGWAPNPGSDEGYIWDFYPNAGRTEVARIVLHKGDPERNKRGSFTKEGGSWSYEDVIAHISIDWRAYRKRKMEALLAKIES